MQTNDDENITIYNNILTAGVYHGDDKKKLIVINYRIYRIYTCV